MRVAHAGPIVAPERSSTAHRQVRLIPVEVRGVGELGEFFRVPNMNSDDSWGRKHSPDSHHSQHTHLPQGESDLFTTKLGQLPHLLARSLDLQRLNISRITRHIRLVKALAKLGDPATESAEPPSKEWPASGFNWMWQGAVGLRINPAKVRLGS